MNQKQVVAHMVTELDWYAREYGRYTQTEVQEMVASEYKQYVSAYNALLGGMYKKVKVTRFPRKIEKYIEYRNHDNWGAWE